MPDYISCSGFSFHNIPAAHCVFSVPPLYKSQEIGCFVVLEAPDPSTVSAGYCAHRLAIVVVDTCNCCQLPKACIVTLARSHGTLITDTCWVNDTVHIQSAGRGLLQACPSLFQLDICLSNRHDNLAVFTPKQSVHDDWLSGFYMKALTFSPVFLYSTCSQKHLCFSCNKTNPGCSLLDSLEPAFRLHHPARAASPNRAAILARYSRFNTGVCVQLPLESLKRRKAPVHFLKLNRWLPVILWQHGCCVRALSKMQSNTMWGK